MSLVKFKATIPAKDKELFDSEIIMRSEDFLEIYQNAIEVYLRYHQKLSFLNDATSQDKVWYQFFNSEITMTIEDLLKVHQNAFEIYLKNEKKIPREELRPEWFKRINESASKLENAIVQKKNVYFIFWDYINTIFSLCLFSKEFVSILCEKCKKYYTPENALVESWHKGSGLAAIGGRMIVCEDQHILYKMLEWYS